MASTNVSAEKHAVCVAGSLDAASTQEAHKTQARHQSLPPSLWGHTERPHPQKSYLTNSNCSEQYQFCVHLVSCYI